MEISFKQLCFYFLTTGDNPRNQGHMQDIFHGFDLTEVNPFEIGVDKNVSGSVGHARLVESGLRSQVPGRPFRPFVIMEDDVSFMRAPPSVLSVPDNSDLVYLGISQLGMVDGKWEEEIFATDVDGDLVRIFNMLSGHAILVCSPAGAAAYQKAMLEGYSKGNKGMWDVYAAEIQPYYNVYALKNPIFYQDKDYGGKEAATRFLLTKYDHPLDLKPNNTNGSCKISSVNHQNLDFLKNLPPIPKKVHIAWRDKDVVNSQNPLILNGLRNLIDMNPDWDVQINIDRTDVEEFLEKHLSEADHSLLKGRPIVEKIDVWRLIKMYLEGGMYMDLDRHCNVVLDDLLAPDLKCILPIHRRIDFSQDLLFTAPHNPIFHYALELNLRRRRCGWTDILTLGPITYFQAATHYIYGFPLLRRPKDPILQELISIIDGSPYISTYLEEPPRDTLIFKFDQSSWNNGNGGSKDDLYKESGVKHWTEDDPIIRDNRIFD